MLPYSAHRDLRVYVTLLWQGDLRVCVTLMWHGDLRVYAILLWHGDLREYVTFHWNETNRCKTLQCVTLLIPLRLKGACHLI